MSETNETRSGSPQQSVDQLATEANGRGILPDQSAQVLQGVLTRIEREATITHFLPTGKVTQYHGATCVSIIREALEEALQR